MISIIVPIYKVEPYLKQCVDSILNQTYLDLEILLIDDGSPDRCGEICDEYAKKDKRIRVFHTENRGLSAARNLGIQKSTGIYLGFVDSDDWLEKDMYEALLNRIVETQADISGCGFYTEFATKSIVSRLKETVYSGIESEIALLDGKVSNYVWNKLYRREVFLTVSFPEGRNFEEMSSMHRIMNVAGKVADISCPKYHYRIRPESITKTYTAKNLIDYVDAHFARYSFCEDEHSELFSEKQEKLLEFVADGISKVWRWWYGCSSEEKRLYGIKINALAQFSRDHFPLICWSINMFFRSKFICRQLSA